MATRPITTTEELSTGHTDPHVAGEQLFRWAGVVLTLVLFSLPSRSDAALVTDPDRLPYLRQVLDFDATLDLDATLLRSNAWQLSDVGLALQADLYRFRAEDPSRPALTGLESIWYLAGGLAAAFSRDPCPPFPEQGSATAGSPLSFDLNLLGALFLSQADQGLGPALRSTLSFDSGTRAGVLTRGALFAGGTLLHRTYGSDRRKRSELLIFSGLGGMFYAVPCAGPDCPTGTGGDESGYLADDGETSSAWSDIGDDGGDGGSGNDGGDDDDGDVGVWATSAQGLRVADPAELDGHLGSFAANLLVQGQLQIFKRLFLRTRLDLRGFPARSRMAELEAEAALRLQLTNRLALNLATSWERVLTGSAIGTYVAGQPTIIRVDRNVLGGKLGFTWELY